MAVVVGAGLQIAEVVEGQMMAGVEDQRMEAAVVAVVSSMAVVVVAVLSSAVEVVVVVEMI